MPQGDLGNVEHETGGRRAGSRVGQPASSSLRAARCGHQGEAHMGAAEGGEVSTYAEGQRIRYPKRGDAVREGPNWELVGHVSVVTDDGTVTVDWGEDGDWTYEGDVLYLHPSGWYWVVPAEEEQEDQGW